MPSSCNDLRDAVAQCLQESDCIMRKRKTPRECITSPEADELPLRCQQLLKGFSECKRSLIDMRKRFRGNRPISSSKGTDGGQLYAGQPAFKTVKETRGDEAQMDPEKTRGL